MISDRFSVRSGMSGKKVPAVCLLLLLAALPLAAQASSWKAGEPAPDFTVNLTDGSSASLSSLRGTPVMLHFWATWCPPCVRELPLIADAASRYAGRLAVFAVSVGEDERTVSSYLARRGGALASFVSGCDGNAAVARLYQVNAVPMTLFLDSAGKILSVHVGAFSAQKLEAAVEAAIRSSAGTPDGNS